jgi:KDO2-lipid IV(A) lauroyltransferase
MTANRPGHRRANSQPAYSLAVARLYCALAARLPLATAQRLAAAVGTVLWNLCRTSRMNAEANLRRALGDGLSADERQQVALDSFRNRCQRLVERAHLPGLTGDALRGLVAVEGIEHILEARQGGRGVMLVSNHFCSPELTAARLALEDLNLAAMARSEHYWTIPGLRQAHSTAALRLMDASDLSAAVTHLRENGCVAILPEVHRRRRSIRFSVAGLPIWIAEGAALVALRSQCPMVPLVPTRGPDGRIRLLIEPLLEVPADNAAPREEMVRAICAALAHRLAHNIRRFPGNWLWLHHRWADGE